MNITRHAAHVLILVVLGGAAVSCAAGSANNDSASGYQASDSQQQGTCDGVPAPKNLSLLPGTVKVSTAVVCSSSTKYVTGQGIWTYSVISELAPAKIGTLVDGLHETDVHADDNTPCSASLLIVPPFVLTLSDGSRIRPGVPGDGCHPKLDAIAAFESNTVVIKQTRTTRVYTDAETTSGCGPNAKSPLIWADATQGSLKSLPALPASGSISICRYHGTADQEGVLTKVGILPVARAKAQWPVVSPRALPVAGSSESCSVPDDPMASPAIDWLMIQTAPSPPYTGDEIGGGSPTALIELGGCHRIVGGQTGLAGYVTAAAADSLAALADHPDR